MKVIPETYTAKNLDSKHFLHPWQDCNSESSDYNMIVRSEGIYLYDANGKKYIDGPGGMWCVNIGYGRKDLAKEIAYQCEKLPYSSPWFSSTEPAARLSHKLSTLTPSDLNTVFFTTCGSTALDSANSVCTFLF